MALALRESKYLKPQAFLELPAPETVKFEIYTPLGFTVRTSEEYWQRLIIKHPDIEELEELIQLALAAPDEVRSNRCN